MCSGESVALVVMLQSLRTAPAVFTLLNSSQYGKCDQLRYDAFQNMLINLLAYEHAYNPSYHNEFFFSPL